MQSEIDLACPPAHCASAFADKLVDGHVAIHAMIQQLFDGSQGAMPADAM